MKSTTTETIASQTMITGKPIMYFFVGGPASGKSFVIERDYRIQKVVLVDSDMLVKFMSFDMAKETATWLLQHLLNSCISVIVASTGANYKECARWFHEASGRNYRTCLVHVECSREVAWSRNCDRGKVMSADIFNQRWDMCDESIPKLKLLADEVVCVFNG